MKGYIYKAVNLCNWKVYIGQTTRKPQTRWNQHIQSAKSGDDKHCIKFYRALRKYGTEMFSFDVIAEVDRNDTKELHSVLDSLEQYYIKYYDSIENGYNITEGGKGHQTGRYLYLEFDRDGNLQEVWRYTENTTAKQYGSDLKYGRIPEPIDWHPKYIQVLEDWQQQINEDIWITEL